MKTREEMYTRILEVLFDCRVKEGTYSNAGIPFNRHTYDLWLKRPSDDVVWEIYDLITELSSPEKKDKKDLLCVADDLVYTSNPPKYRCRYCLNWWTPSREDTPVCTRNKPKSPEKKEEPTQFTKEELTLLADLLFMIEDEHSGITPILSKIKRMLK